ncbi:hypothetical protein [Streptomyces sp. NPDC088794]|uniref:hypothetical protein n=1 Tax=Streptomyces sp. NPDC088794 TaxID=3365902 RepID=UPI0038057DF3
MTTVLIAADQPLWRGGAAAMTTVHIAADQPLWRSRARGPGGVGRGWIAGVVFDVSPGGPLL